MPKHFGMANTKFNAVVPESMASTFSSNTEGSGFLRNVNNYLGDYTALHYTKIVTAAKTAILTSLLQKR
jgi:hypothetical protein